MQTNNKIILNNFKRKIILKCIRELVLLFSAFFDVCFMYQVLKISDLLQLLLKIILIFMINFINFINFIYFFWRNPSNCKSTRYYKTWICSYIVGWILTFIIKYIIWNFGPSMQTILELSICYGLKFFLPLEIYVKILMLNCNGIRGWGLWEVLRSWEWSPHE